MQWLFSFYLRFRVSEFWMEVKTSGSFQDICDKILVHFQHYNGFRAIIDSGDAQSYTKLHRGCLMDGICCLTIECNIRSHHFLILYVHSTQSSSLAPNVHHYKYIVPINILFQLLYIDFNFRIIET